MQDSLKDIRDSALSGKLVVIMGAGTSVALTSGDHRAKTWTGLIESGLMYGHSRSRMTDNQLTQYKDLLVSHDIDDLLGAAEFVRRKLDGAEGLFARWLETEFKRQHPDIGAMSQAIKSISTAGIPIATTNYDTLLEEVTNHTGIDFEDLPAVLRWSRREDAGILHLHGTWTRPDTCILGVRDYHTAVKENARAMLQQALASFNRILFIGCGDTLEDPNFSSIVQWSRQHLKAAQLQHYALVRNGDVRARAADPTWAGFVDPVGYGEKHSDLPAFIIERLLPPVSRRKPPASRVNPDDRTKRVLESYRDFVVRDCGQMTVEGVRADLNTSQRKFDLEKLFVPLDVSPVPPELAMSDPAREQKIAKWKETNPDKLSFGAAFSLSKRIALLALPGGGKTLLLKRLAVAYAKPSRRPASNDDLPDLDLIPIIIRCREWKEHITKPFPALLDSIPIISGDSSLRGVGDALKGVLKSGHVILLIDGMDEIHNDAERTTFAENLEIFLNKYPKIRLLVTSREAGFDLVAPCLVRFCERYRIAPLSEPAIRLLNEHWHRLMSGDTAESLSEAAAVAEKLTKNDSLRKLAENPLLLTMLLVVKHGNGRLPPDRVGLYELAVAILLDTWNIRGHEPLNVRESVPQLACLAYELLKRGKQTATESEILEILEEARDSLPRIKRYAKDTPHDFLKRVELRSSLLVEAGHTNERSKTVPFYQFRHLTFQEYLASVAAVGGYHLDYKRGDSLLAPLQDVLLNDEWKEVVPMAAVLGGRQADSLIHALVESGLEEERRYLLEMASAEEEALMVEGKLPPATNRILQCLIGEAEIPPELTIDALRLVALFGHGCRTADDWSALARGPYGQDLIDQAWTLFVATINVRSLWVRNTLAVLLNLEKPAEYWASEDGVNDILSRLNATDEKEVVTGTLGVAGSLWKNGPQSPLRSSKPIAEKIEQLLCDQRLPVWTTAAWSFGFLRRLARDKGEAKGVPPTSILQHLVYLYFNHSDAASRIVSFVICTLSDLDNHEWNMSLNDEEVSIIKETLKSGQRNTIRFDLRYELGAALVLANRDRKSFPEKDIVAVLRSSTLSPMHRDILAPLAKQFKIDIRSSSRTQKRRESRKVTSGSSTPSSS